MPAFWIQRTEDHDMSQPALTLLVQFKSKLSFDDVMKIAEERAPEFEALEGLQQKYYLQDSTTGEIAGLYLWQSPEALAAYRDSELRASIAEAYQAEGEPRVQVYRVVKALREDAD
jgi:heme-degrading monooxygenase HmoA